MISWKCSGWPWLSPDSLFCHVPIGSQPRFNGILPGCFISMCLEMCFKEHILNVEFLHSKWSQTSPAVDTSKDMFIFKAQRPELCTIHLHDRRNSHHTSTVPISFSRTTHSGCSSYALTGSSKVEFMLPYPCSRLSWNNVPQGTPLAQPRLSLVPHLMTLNAGSLFWPPVNAVPVWLPSLDCQCCSIWTLLPLPSAWLLSCYWFLPACHSTPLLSGECDSVLRGDVAV